MPCPVIIVQNNDNLATVSRFSAYAHTRTAVFPVAVVFCNMICMCTCVHSCARPRPPQWHNVHALKRPSGKLYGNFGSVLATFACWSERSTASLSKITCCFISLHLCSTVWVSTSCQVWDVSSCSWWKAKALLLCREVRNFTRARQGR